jgi:predicted SAM-dependent methyltransferase
VIALKLHLGCGKRFLKGYVHVDIEPFEHVDFVATIDNLDFIEDETVTEIYSSHSFEYFDRSQAKTVLEEWSRVLVPGGVVYLTVPDFAALVSIYSTTGDLNAIVGPLFGRWDNSGNILYHKTTWDFATLQAALDMAGFVQIGKFSPIVYLEKVDFQYDDYSLAFFPHMDREGIQVSLAISAIKPIK